MGSVRIRAVSTFVESALTLFSLRPVPNIAEWEPMRFLLQVLLGSVECAPSSLAYQVVPEFVELLAVLFL